MRICIFMMTVFLSVIPAAAPAQMSASKDAQYLATIKAVANYKIDDEEELRNVCLLYTSDAADER